MPSVTSGSRMFKVLELESSEQSLLEPYCPASAKMELYIQSQTASN